GRHTAPAFPAGCWHVALAPSHWSSVQGLPSEVHAVPAGELASAGQLGPLPVQVSCGSHSPADARHTTVEGWKPSVGQVVLLPVQVSATSQRPAAGRQTVPGLPAGCVHAGAPAVPLHTSVVHTLPSSVQAVPAVWTASAGQVVLVPVQLSARSHSLTAARHTVPEDANRSAGQVLLEPVQVSGTSQAPADA